MFFPFADRTVPATSSGLPRSSPLPRLARGLCPLGLAGACLFSACGGTEVLGSTPPTSCDLAGYELGGNTRQEIKVATFWTDTEERKAFAELQGSLPSTSSFWVSDRDSRDDQQKTLRDLLLNDSDPLPDAFQVNGGSDVLQWVSDDSFDERLLCPLDRLDEDYGLRGHHFPAALAPVSCHGFLYGLPVGVHQLNVLFYNADLVDQLVQESADGPTPLSRPDELQSVEDFIEHLQQVQALLGDSEESNAVVPLALGNSIAWPLTILAFENLMVAQDNTYEAVWMGPPEEHGLTEGDLRGRFAELVEHLRALALVSNLEAHVEWQEALQMVARGQAVYTVMGDWGWAQVANEGSAVMTIPFPGTSGTFVYTPDSFSIPRRRGTDGAGAHVWLREVVDNRTTQIAFARKKHSIPSIRNLSDDELGTLKNARLTATYREFADCQLPGSDCRLLLAVSGLGPPPGADPCFDEVGKLLLRAIGIWSLEDLDAVEDGEPRTCEKTLPGDPEEAANALIDLMVGVADKPFARRCR